MDSSGPFPPSQHPRGKKPTDLDLFVVNFRPLKLPTNVPELLETRLPHSNAHTACQGSTRCQTPPVICFNCYLNLTHSTNETINTTVNLERCLEELEQVSS